MSGFCSPKESCDRARKPAAPQSLGNLVQPDACAARRLAVSARGRGQDAGRRASAHRPRSRHAALRAGANPPHRDPETTSLFPPVANDETLGGTLPISGNVSISQSIDVPEEVARLVPTFASSPIIPLPSASRSAPVPTSTPVHDSFKSSQEKMML